MGQAREIARRQIGAQVARVAWMPGGPHELFLVLGDLLGPGFVEMFGRWLGIEIVPGAAVSRFRPIDKGVRQLVGPEHGSDRAYELCAEDEVVGAMVLEAQQSPLEDKALTWPLYWAMLRKRVGGAPTWVVVLTTSSEIERASEAMLAEVIPRAGRWLVLGPARMPRITDPELARREPALALVSALIHAGGDDVELAPAIADALETISAEVARVSYDVLRLRLSAAALAAMEVLVEINDYQFKSDFALENQHKGRMEERVETLQQAVRTVLEARGFTLTPSQQAILDACSKDEQLDTWLRRAVTAPTVDAIFS